MVEACIARSNQEVSGKQARETPDWLLEVFDLSLSQPLRKKGDLYVGSSGGKLSSGQDFHLTIEYREQKTAPVGAQDMKAAIMAQQVELEKPGVIVSPFPALFLVETMQELIKRIDLQS